MRIEKLSQVYLEETIALVNDCFEEFVGCDFEEEGRQAFYRVSKTLGQRPSDVYIALDGQVVGMIEVQNRHINLWFVKKTHMNKGIGRALFDKACQHMIENINVNASEYAVAVYEKLGFVKTSGLKEKHGIKYYPMSLDRHLSLRPESVKDFQEIDKVLLDAFDTSEEKELVNRLRQTKDYIHDLALLAEIESKVIGYCMMTTCKIGQHEGYLALAPIAVLGDFQGLGIGGSLINKAIEIAKTLGYKGIVVLGHETYYPRFGFELAEKYGIKCPFDVPSQNYMYMPLETSNEGVVEYSSAFGL